jgi:antirestriction protein ArdC
MPSQQQLRESITAKIIAALEQDLLPWRRMWSTNNAGRHANVVSKKPYSGVNPMLLEMHALEHGFQSKWWATFNQWHTLGCVVKRRPDHVEPGQWGAGIVVYLPITKEIKDPKTGEEEEETYWVLRKFTLFNAEQVEGKAAERYQFVELPDTSATPDFAPADELVLESGAEICFGGDRAYYRRPTPEGTWPNHRDGDYIQMPPKSCFVNGSYYTTLIHEMGHWSEIRLKWDHDKQGYAMGELVAEIAAAYLCAELGVPDTEPLENHAAYVKSWLEAMKNDPSYIFKASKQASKVCDFLLSFVKQPETQPNPNNLIEAA